MVKNPKSKKKNLENRIDKNITAKKEIPFFEAKEIIDKELSVTDMFRFPTIRALTGYLGQESDNGGKTTVQKSIDRAVMGREAIMQGRRRYENL